MPRRLSPLLSLGSEATATRLLLLTVVLLVASAWGFPAAGGETKGAGAQTVVSADDHWFKFFATIHSSRDINKLDYGFDAIVSIL